MSEKINISVGDYETYQNEVTYRNPNDITPRAAARRIGKKAILTTRW